MDILNSKNPEDFIKPQILNLGKCNYRRYGAEIEIQNKNTSKLGPYLDNDDDMINCAEIEDDLEIKVTKSGKFIAQFHIAPVFYPTIIGVKGTNKRQLESATDTSIKIPKVGESGNIIITGNSERSISSAHARLQMLVLQLRDKQQMTHFISVPVASSEIDKQFQIFKSNLLDGPPLRGVDDSIFQRPNKFHLTIAPLVLMDDIEKLLAIQLLQECKEEIISPLFKNADPMRIILEGLEIMNDDPSDVDVLYAKVKLSLPKYGSSFQSMADKIVEHFANKGLIRKQYESVKLHVTLMNSLFRRGNAQNERHVRESFDATYILQKYKNFRFGETDLNAVHLSIRFVNTDGKYYDSLSTINIF